MVKSFYIYDVFIEFVDVFAFRGPTLGKIFGKT